jgi:hypothetical protein
MCLTWLFFRASMRALLMRCPFCKTTVLAGLPWAPPTPHVLPHVDRDLLAESVRKGSMSTCKARVLHKTWTTMCQFRIGGMPGLTAAGHPRSHRRHIHPRKNVPAVAVGLTSLSMASYIPAYPAQAGWSFANGLGPVNAATLFKAWKKFDALHSYPRQIAVAFLRGPIARFPLAFDRQGDSSNTDMFNVAAMDSDALAALQCDAAGAA